MFRGAVVQPFLRRATSCTTGARLTSAKGSEMSDFNPPTPPPVGPPGTPGAAPVPLSDAETRQWAGFAHLGGILWFLPSLIIWLMYKDRSAFVGQEARKALNFQITLAIGWVVVFLLGFFVPFVGLLGFLIWIVSVVFSVMAFQAVNRGQAYTYPFSLELVK